MSHEGEEPVRDQEVQRYLETEQIIITNVEARTGSRPRSLGLLDLGEEAKSDEIADVLVEWLDRDASHDASARGMLYLALGKYPNLRRFYPRALAWWAAEDDEINLSSITGLLKHSISSSNACAVWDVVRNRSWSNGFADLYVKLATIRALRKDVVAAIVRILDTQAVSVGAVERLARIKDPDVRSAVERQQRRVGNSGLQKPSKRPHWLKAADEDRIGGTLIFHGEMDAADLDARLRVMGSEQGIQFPDFSAALPFLSNAPCFAWYQRTVNTDAGQKLAVCLRAEDVDALEVVIFVVDEGSPAGAEPLGRENRHRLKGRNQKE